MFSKCDNNCASWDFEKFLLVIKIFLTDIIDVNSQYKWTNAIMKNQINTTTLAHITSDC